MVDWLTDIEIWATLFGLACVALTVRQNIWCWPTGLVMVTLYIVIFHDAKLYSDMGLQVVYVFMQIYGWWRWLHPDDGDELPVTTLSRREWAAWWAVGIAGTVALGRFMSTQTDAALPYPDAATTVLSLVAQWLMAQKRLANWVFWIVVDVIAIGVYYVKELYPTTVLYAVFLILATSGYLVWRGTLRRTAIG